MYLRKGLEAYFTVVLELLWPKRRMLEVYLNIAEFGEGIYGVAAAAQAFFGKRPAGSPAAGSRTPGGGAAESGAASRAESVRLRARACRLDRGPDASTRRSGVSQASVACVSVESRGRCSPGGKVSAGLAREDQAGATRGLTVPPGIGMVSQTRRRSGRRRWNVTSADTRLPEQGSTMTKRSSKGKGITSIVLADNDALLLEAVGDFLRESGFVVHVAQDGLEALELCRREKPDCAVLDVIMPKLDGARVCWLLRQDPTLRDTFVIAFSSLSPRDYRAFPEMSADAYVAKGPLPISYQHLLSAIRRFQAGNDATVAEGIVGYDQVQPLQVVREMLEERRRHQNILRALGADVLELDLTGRIVSANPGACEVLRAKEANLIGRSVTDLVLASRGGRAGEPADRSSRTRWSRTPVARRSSYRGEKFGCVSVRSLTGGCVPESCWLWKRMGIRIPAWGEMIPTDVGGRGIRLR